jgi:hypothetical protein
MATIGHCMSTLKCYLLCSDNRTGHITMHKIRIAAAALSLAALCGCTDPYDPGQRAVGGGLLGAGAGAGIGALAGGGRGAAIGALAGGALGAGTGYVTTPQPPRYGGYGY